MQNDTGGGTRRAPSPRITTGAIALEGDRERRPLLATEFNERRPALSPDERWLAYQSDESGQYEIYVRPSPNVGAGKTQVSSDEGHEPMWSTDGRTLFFLSPTGLMETAVSTAPSFTAAVPSWFEELKRRVPPT